MLDEQPSRDELTGRFSHQPCVPDLSATGNTATRSTTCFRLKPYFRNVGISCTALFSAIGLASVFMAYFNVDGSFPNPLHAATSFGLFWACFVLLGVCLLLLHRRYRLFVTEDSVRQRGVVSDRTVTLSQVRELKWRRYPAGGSVQLSATDGRLKIDLGNFVQSERDELVSFLLESVPEGRQLGWSKFQEQFQDSPERRMRSRRSSQVVSLLLGIHSVAFLVFWGLGLGNQYLVVAIVNAAFLVYFRRGLRIRSLPQENGEPVSATNPSG